LVGLIPYTVTTTAQLMVSFGLGFSSFFGLNVIAYKIWGSTFLNLFLPPEGTPSILNPFLIAIELISYIFRVFSLSIRLFANMMAGHTLLKILSSFSWEMNSVDCFSFYFLKFIPAIIVFGVLFLEFGIGILQAYIFTVLLSLYLKDALFLH
jgi:F-type H+-transporting ATPase subunit a